MLDPEFAPQPVGLVGQWIAGNTLMRLVIFGVSNSLGTILDTARVLNLTPSLVVMNTPEIIRPRTKSFREHMRLLERPPEIMQMEEFFPQRGECYFLGTISPNRRQLVNYIRSRFGITCCTLIHPTAYVSGGVDLGAGVYVGACTSIATGAQLCEHAFVGSNAHVAHDTIVHSYARILTGTNVAGHVQVGYGATIGFGATVVQELEIGPEAYVAAGAVVVQDVAARTLVAGVPARFKRNL